MTITDVGTRVSGGRSAVYYTLFKYLLFRPVCLIFFRPVIVGEHNIPATGGAVIAGNHLSSGETFLLPAVIRRPMTFPAKAELFRGDKGWQSKVVAWFLRAVGQVPLDRSGGTASARSLQPVMEVLQAGGLVGIFPEGTRSRDGRLYRGRTGVARLAVGARVPVVPVGFFDTQMFPGPFGIPWMRRPRIVIGEPLDFTGRLGPGADEHAVLREITDEVMEAIRALTGQEYVDEYAVRVSRGSGDGVS